MLPRCYLCAPAYPLESPAALDQCTQRAQGLCLHLGWQLHLDPLLTQYRPRGTWLPAPERVVSLAQGLRHEVLWAARGGHGCQHLLAALPAQLERPPLLIGYSDVTCLLAAWWQRNWPAVHGLMPAVPSGPDAASSLTQVVHEQTLRWEHPTGSEVIRPGQAQGRLFSACLRVLASLCGTQAQPDLRGAIVLLEDIDEAPYAVDRALCQLDDSGLLRGVRALMCGTFPWPQPADYQGLSHQAVFHHWAERLNVPCVFGLPFGHHPDPLSVPQAWPAYLEVHQDRWLLAAEAPAWWPRYV